MAAHLSSQMCAPVCSNIIALVFQRLPGVILINDVRQNTCNSGQRLNKKVFDFYVNVLLSR